MRSESHAAPRDDDAFAREVRRRATAQRLEVFLSSLELADGLTHQQLEDGPSLPRLVSLAADLATYADAAIAIVRQEHQPPLACGEGCSYCCRKPGVLVSIPDLLRVLDRVRTTFDDAARAGVRERAHEYVELLNGRSFDEPTTGSIPCPLLINDRCSVYDVRPLTCRGYNSTSVDACRQAHESTEALVPIFSMIKDATDGTTVGAALHMREIGFNDALVDLGTALHIALEAGEGFAERVASGAPELRSAENAKWVDEMLTRVHQTARTFGVDVTSGG